MGWRFRDVNDTELSMSKRYTVSDGKMVLNIEEAEEVVSS